MSGKSPIPRSKIREYGLEYYGKGEEFVDVIRKMDAAFLNHSDK